MADKRDYYDILSVSKTASAEEIKRAYRKLAKEHHPDKHGGADVKFKELGEAYETLKDPGKRSQYDQFGHADPFGGQSGSAGQAGYQDFSGFGDIFESFFRGATGGGGGQRKGRDMEVGVELTFQEAVFGTEKTIQIELQDVCSRCKGTTAEPGSKLATCKTCNGQGQLTQVQQTVLGAFRQSVVCSTCKGSGQTPEQVCVKCWGKGVEVRTKQLKVNIPAGVDHGATMRVSGEGEAAAGVGGGKGDLYVHIRVKSDRRFAREGQNIISGANIPMINAALGTEVPIETVDGKITLKIPAGTQSGKVFRLSGKGVPQLNGRGRGDHLVHVNVETPTKLTNRQKELLEAFGELGSKRFWQK